MTSLIPNRLQKQKTQKNSDSIQGQVQVDYQGAAPEKRKIRENLICHSIL